MLKYQKFCCKNSENLSEKMDTLNPYGGNMQLHSAGRRPTAGPRAYQSAHKGPLVALLERLGFQTQLVSRSGISLSHL